MNNIGISVIVPVYTAEELIGGIVFNENIYLGDW